ncbi:MAG TPA: protein kinase [Thermoanaerobaculia bacterium]
MIAAGTKLGPYEILSPLGEGGMGEVFRAKDTRLGREVALKVLSARVATNASARERFERESKAVAALSHPNILALYDVGLEGETAYAVTELLEGQTLRKALQPGSLPIRKALDVAMQVGKGLVAAHEKGIVHRDLKPENLFVTRSGHVKILDFGLAKLSLAESDDSGPAGISNSGQTEPGRILGTVGYMSPEQVRGQPADARSDIFSLGAILYEMLSGKRAFHRDSGIDTLSAILKEEPPDLVLTNQLVPPGLDRLVRHCLEKDAALRFQTARDLVFDLETLSGESLSGSLGMAAPAERPSLWRRARVPLAAALVALLAAGAAWILATRVRGRGASSHPTFQRLTSQPGGETKPALSPDGETVAFVSTASGNRDIWIQRVGSDKAINLTADSTVDEMDPAFSPDGSLIAFHSDRDGGGLYVMGPAGESVRRVTAGGFSPDWTPDGKEIVYADEEITSPLLRSRSRLWAANVASGEKRQLLATDGVEPAVSPHGLRVAFWGLRGDTAQRDVYTIPLAGLKEGETAGAVTNDAAVDVSPFWSPDGKTLYFGSDRGGSFNLWRVPIDERTGLTRGEPEPVTLPTTWAGIFPGSFRGARSRARIAFTAPAELMAIEKVTLDPATLAPAGPPAVLRRGSAMFLDLELSPDGSTLATRTQGATENLCVLAADGTNFRQLTRDSFRNRWARWSPDGQRIFFYSNRSGAYGVWTIKPDGSDMTRVAGLPEASWAAPVPSPDGMLIALGRPSTSHVVVVPFAPAAAGSAAAPAPPLEIEGKWAWDWSPDGRQLLVLKRGAVASSGVLLCAMPGGRCELLAPHAEQARFFPDGRHVGYVERGEIHVLDLATRASRVLVAARADSPITRFCISRDGRALYFLRDVSEGDIWVATFP